jgi:hypothetical protein
MGILGFKVETTAGSNELNKVIDKVPAFTEPNPKMPTVPPRSICNSLPADIISVQTRVVVF